MLQRGLSEIQRNDDELTLRFPLRAGGQPPALGWLVLLDKIFCLSCARAREMCPLHRCIRKACESALYCTQRVQ